MLVPVYCEYNPHFFIHQPINFLSNIGCFIIAFYFFIKWAELRAISKILTVVLTILGIGSAWFHGAPSAISLFGDIIPSILFFSLYFYWVLYVPCKWKPLYAGVAIFIYILCTFFIMYKVPIGFLDGVAGYLLLLFMLFALGCGLLYYRSSIAYFLFITGGIFVISGFFRSIDLFVCPDFPIGTHFLWHFLNQVMFALLIQSTRAHYIGETHDQP